MRLHFLGGWLLGVFTVFGCASTQLFPWTYYGEQMPTSCYDQGKLLANTESGSPDLALTTCKPDPSPSPGASTSPVLLKCITVKIDDFYDLKGKYEKCQSDLSACEQGNPPSGASL